METGVFSSSVSPSSNRWQAHLWPGLTSRISGARSQQTFMQCWQRVWKTQPAGGLVGLGTSPSSGIRCRVLAMSGSGMGMAEISDWV